MKGWTGSDINYPHREFQRIFWIPDSFYALTRFFDVWFNANQKNMTNIPIYIYSLKNWKPTIDQYRKQTKNNRQFFKRSMMGLSKFQAKRNYFLSSSLFCDETRPKLLFLWSLMNQNHQNSKFVWFYFEKFK